MPPFEFDAWADKTPDELKTDCRRLSRALSRWQRIALCVSTPGTIAALPMQWRDEINRLIDAYTDTDD